MSSARPLSGSYAEADPMGLFWSMVLDENEPERSMFAKAGVSPLAVSFATEINGETVATLRHERFFLFSAAHLSYPGAGHYLSFPYLPVTIQHMLHPIVKTVFAFGGFPKDHCQAQADSWLKVIRFLEENLVATCDRSV